MSSKKSTTASAPKKARAPFSRHSEKLRQNVITFMQKGNTAAAAKERFGVSAHFAGKIAREAGIAPAAKKSAPVPPHIQN